MARAAAPVVGVALVTSTAATMNDATRVRPNALIGACFVYIGLAAAIPQYTAREVSTITPGFLLTAILGFLGIRGVPWCREAKRYLAWALLFTSWAFIATVANGSSWREPMLYAIWLLILIPGLAALLTERQYLHSLILGFGAGAAVYAITAAFRAFTRGNVLDTGLLPNQHYLLGVNRGIPILVVLVALPYFLAGEGGSVFRACRWPIVACSVVWLIRSGSRSALLALALVVMVHALLQPGVSRRMQTLFVTVIVAVIAIILIQEVGGEASNSTERLLSFGSGERDDSDAARELLLRKAWNLGLDSPVFGVGFGRFEEIDHEVLKEARSVRVKRLASNYQEHNTFAAILAEAGFPGLLFFVGVFVSMLLAGVRHIRHRAPRAPVASFAGLIVGIFFMNAFGHRLFLPFAILLSAVFVARLDTFRDAHPVVEPA